MTKRSAKFIIAVLMILTVCLYLISGTYARYATEASSDATVTVAKWAASIKSGSAAISDANPLTFNVVNNANVVSGKIAPAVTATAEATVDLTGTEVAVDLIVDIDSNALDEYFSSVDVTSSATGTCNGSEVEFTENDGKLKATINLVDDKAFTANNGTVTINMSVVWTNDDQKNAEDTIVGTNAPTVTIPVTITVQQHID